MAKNYELVFLTVVRPNGAFDRRATETWVRPFEVRPWVKFLKCWPGETSDLYANGPESFPTGIFTHFGRATAKNYESVFLTVVRPKPRFGPFDRRATISLSRYFWPMVRLMEGG